MSLYARDDDDDYTHGRRYLMNMMMSMRVHVCIINRT